jgi:hypothetical protein
LQFIAADRLYRFGFKVDEERITEEWLFQVVGNRQKMLYNRATDKDGKVVIDANGLRSAGEKVMALATVGGPQDQSFLATVKATLNAGDLGEELARVLTWFQEGLNIISPDEPIGPDPLDQDTDFLSFAGAFLKSASTGVDHLEILKQEVSKDDPRRSVPDIIRRANGYDRIVRARVADNRDLLIEGKVGGSVYEISIQAAHEHEPGKVVGLNLTEESDGTRRLLNLISALHGSRATDPVYVIDEIDRSLHPMLVREFLEFFLKSRDGGPSQLIVTTHESSLLDQDLLRRDEIWFAEKDQTGATRLYSLIDFKVRNDLEIRKHYLQGRFGAVPFLGGLEDLSAKTDRPE